MGGVAATPLGLKTLLEQTQGSSYVATLGYVTQSLWDWEQLPRLKCLIVFHSVSQRSQAGPCQTVGRQFQPAWFTAVMSGDFISFKLNV